jgi:predicted small metal-binding protein
MAKILRCRDVGMDCDFEVHASTEEEILQRAADHAQTAHGLKEIPEEIVTKGRAAIREE